VKFQSIGLSCTHRIYDPQLAVPLHTDVWILHPEHPGKAIGKGKAGVSWKTPKSKSLTSIVCEVGAQLVMIEQVLYPNIKPMYQAHQLHLDVLEDALNSAFVNDCWVMWGSNYLLPVD
jgi:hypothetical protein